MALIISCHVLQYYKIELCYYLNVGVQIFFIVSGWLYGRREINAPVRYIKKNFSKILLPYYLFLFLAILLYAFYCPQELDVISVGLSAFCAGTLPGLGHLWFVGYILFCYLLAPYLCWIRNSIADGTPILKVTSIYAMLFLLSQVLGFAFRSYFTPPFIGCFLIGFFVSDLHRRYGEKVIKVVMLVSMLLTLATLLPEVYLKYIACREFTGIYDYAFNEYCHYGHMFLGSVLFFLLMILLDKRIRYDTMLQWTDNHSYEVYLVHQLFILSPLTLMEITSHSYINITVAVIASLVAGWLLHVSVDRLRTIRVNTSKIQ